MTQFNPGDLVTYTDYGTPYRAKVTEVKPSGIVYVRRLDGPLAGRMKWTFSESLTKEAA